VCRAFSLITAAEIATELNPTQLNATQRKSSQAKRSEPSETQSNLQCKDQELGQSAAQKLSSAKVE